MLITTIATLTAALSTGLGLGAGAETRQPIVVAILGGMPVSTFLNVDTGGLCLQGDSRVGVV